MDIDVIDVAGATVGEHRNEFRACCPLKFFGKQPEIVCGDHVSRCPNVVQGVIGKDGYRFTINRLDEKRGDIRIGRSNGFNDVGIIIPRIHLYRTVLHPKSSIEHAARLFPDAVTECRWLRPSCR